MMYQSRFKRLLDFTISSVALLVTGLPLLIAMIGVRASSPGPIFFFQERVGLDENSFRIFKLRTMTVNQERQAGQTTNTDPEVFAFGKLLRRFKIDELPQIVNVLKGDMSLVGPRPCMKHTLDEMPDWARARFSVRPGITGLAQINGNVALSWEERWKHDIRYVEAISFAIDMKIILRTILVVVFGEERFQRKI